MMMILVFVVPDSNDVVADAHRDCLRSGVRC